MRKLIKITLFILSIMCLFTVPTMASQIEDIQPLPFYLSFTGTVKEVEKVDDVITKIYLEGEDETPAYFVLNENTYYADEVKIEKGLQITGYYESGRPMILIYPPQYTIDIVTPVYEEGFVKADKFDSDLLSKDKQLKLNISENTDIIWENNTVINWIKQPTVEELKTVLTNRQMIVYYDFTTKSIPAQTTPNKIIVLSQQIEDKINIIVEDNIIEAPNAYISDFGNVMVPVRAIAEAMGYEVKWNNEDRSVAIGESISFKLNEKNFKSNESVITLEEPSVLNNELTYVPLSFFKEVININVVSFIENNIIINTGRPFVE